MAHTVMYVFKNDVGHMDKILYHGIRNVISQYQLGLQHTIIFLSIMVNFNLPIISSVNQFKALSVNCQRIVKNAYHNFPEPNVTH